MTLPHSIFQEFAAFRSISAVSLTKLSELSTLLNMPAGMTLLESLTTPPFLYAVLSGHLDAMLHSEGSALQRVRSFGRGDVIGWLSVIDNKPSPLRIVSTTATSLLLIPLPVAREILLHEPLANLHVLESLSTTIRQHMDERRVLSLANAFQRVFMLLNLLHEDNPAGDTWPKQQEIANRANTSRETVSRAIQLLAQSGIIKKEGHQIVVQNPDQLRLLAMHGPKVSMSKA